MEAKETSSKKAAELGILTLAIPKDYKKAIALSLTLKEHSPNLPISIVCPKALQDKVAPYFEQVIIERDDLKGFEHKLYLDEYSPYQKTFFFDADILIIKDIMPIIKKWSGSAYAVRGTLVGDNKRPFVNQKGRVESRKSSFGLDRKYVLELINKKVFSVIDGAGHAYFEKPACKDVFDLARSILKEYPKYQADRFADEDAIAIAMTMLEISPKDNEGFLGSPWCSINNSFMIDTDRALCRYEDAVFGAVQPFVVHFPSFVYPVTYSREIIKTFKRHNVKIDGIWRQAIKESFTLNVTWRLGKLYRKLFR